MTSRILKLALTAVLGASAVSWAQAPAGAPGDATGQCKDGTYTTNPNKPKACVGHKGVKSWYQTVGGPDDPSLKSSTGSQKQTEKQTANSDAMVNPHSSTTMSSQRANAINQKSGDVTVATPDDNGKTMPGPAASAGGNAAGHNSAKSSSAGSVASRSAAPGGGPGLVWLNSESNVYHCYGTTYYGKTKSGKYVSEKDAMNAGDKPNHGRSCSAK